MTIIDEAIQDQADVWFDQEDLAISAIYRSGGQGSGSAVPIVVQFGGEPQEDSPYFMERATMIVPADTITDPEQNDTIELPSGDIWTVRKILQGNRVAWLVEVDKNVRASG
jgi:hypothetical protein